MKDGEKALLALAAVGGYLYWSKTETKKSNIWTTGAGSSGSTFSTGPAAYKQKANVPTRVLTPVPGRKEMFGGLSKADQDLLMKDGGRMTDKQKVKLMEKYGWYAKGMHPDKITFHANGTIV